MVAAIQVRELSKTFTVKKSSPGLLGALKGLLYTRKYPFKAINEISFEIEAGERVAFIGPNGAGKSTTIKILTGILYPTSGEAHVLGLVPWQNRQKLGYHIGTVFGQRTQLWYQLPPSDTFALLGKIYELDETFYRQRIKELTQVFEIGPFLDKPVRQLSLGERMRCEIVASLIHRPQILFLDEPTIGLDINAKLMIRDLLNRLSYEQGTTLFLTSHDTADIEKVCERVIILDKGQLIKDSSIKELKRTALKKKVVSLLVADEHFSLKIPGVKILRRDKHHLVCEVDLAITSIDYVMQEAFKRTSVKDVTIEDPSMEEIIREIYGTSTQSMS